MNAVTKGMVFNDKMHHLTNALDNDGLVLLPTESVWCIGANMHSKLALNKIVTLKSKVSQYPITILVNSIAMLKEYCPALPPKIETLLYYFERPITIVFPASNTKFPQHITEFQSTVAVRLSLEPLCQTLIDLMSNPIIVSSARCNSHTFPTSFDEIDSEIIRNVNYICQHKSTNTGFIPEAIISSEGEGDLVFLRE